jgi:TonB family protein
LRLADEYLARGDVKEALSIYQMISDTDPTNLDVKSRLGDLLQLVNQKSEAFRVFTDLARCSLRQGLRPDAIAALKKAFEIRSSEPDMLVDLGDVCSSCGMSAEAHSSYLSAGDVFADRGENAKAAAAYQSAATVRPDDPELQMKLGSVCHALGRLQDSYRAFVRAADGFKRRGQDRAALDAYGRAVNDALSGAEGSSAMAEFIAESEPVRVPGTGGLRSFAALPTRPLVLEKAAPTGQEAAQKVELPGAAKKTGATDEPVVGSIATAEVLIGLGQFDEAIALMKSLAKDHPNDPRIRRKLTGLCSRSELPETSVAFRELASAYLAAGDAESYADCMASALKVSAASTKSPSVAASGGNGVLGAVRPASPGLSAGEGAGMLASAGSTAHARGRRLETVSVKIRGVKWSRYWAAVAFVVLLGVAGGYMVIRGSQTKNDKARNPSVDEVNSANSAKVDEPQVVALEGQPEPSEESVRTGEGQASDRPSSDRPSREAVQKQQPGNTQSRASGAAQEAAAEPQRQEQPKPTPPTVGSIGPFSGAGGTGQNGALGSLVTEIAPAPPPPTPRPSVRRAAVMAGGEVVRRMQPAYPAAARSAHITGTVTVELAINEQGNVTSARASSGPPLLAGAAESAARGFKFTPITLDGVPVKSNRTVLFHFKE